MNLLKYMSERRVVTRRPSSVDTTGGQTESAEREVAIEGRARGTRSIPMA
jgi:hypothetical protein